MWNRGSGSYAKYHPWHLGHDTVEAHHLISCEIFKEDVDRAIDNSWWTQETGSCEEGSTP